MNSERNRHQMLSAWQLIFKQSKVNGAPYDGEHLPVHKWDWPSGTYLQRRRSAHAFARFAFADSHHRELCELKPLSQDQRRIRSERIGGVYE